MVWPYSILPILRTRIIYEDVKQVLSQSHSYQVMEQDWTLGLFVWSHDTLLSN